MKLTTEIKSMLSEVKFKYSEMEDMLDELQRFKNSRDWDRWDIDAEHIFPTTSKNHFGQDILTKKSGDDYVAEIRTNGGTSVKKTLKDKDPKKLLQKLEKWMVSNKVKFIDESLAEEKFKKGDKVELKDNDGKIRRGEIFNVDKKTKTYAVEFENMGGTLWGVSAKSMTKVD